jgi:hypothetical protein
VVLTSEPVGTVTIDAAAIATRTFNADLKFDETANRGEANEVQLQVDQTELVFEIVNWDVPQTVTVTAIDDALADGGEAKVFADTPDRVNRIRGPLTIEGGTGGKPERSIADPFMMPGETNERIPDSDLTTAGTNTLVDDARPWFIIETFDVTNVTVLELDNDLRSSLAFEDKVTVFVNGVERPGTSFQVDYDADTVEFLNDPPNGLTDTVTGLVRVEIEKDISGFLILILDGPGANQARIVASNDGPTLTLNEPWSIIPEPGDPYFFAPVNPNVTVIEPDQVDTLNVFNTDSVADDKAVLTDTSLSGLGMGPHTVIEGFTFKGGITYAELEAINIYLGSGNDEFMIESTHLGSTTVHSGPGVDTINTRTVNGHTVVKTGSEIDTVNVGRNVPASDGLVDQIAGVLVVDGGSDRIEGAVSSADGDSLTDTSASFPAALPGSVDSATLAENFFVEEITQPSFGTLVVVEQLGFITFTPEVDFGDFDSFVIRYQLRDDTGAVATFRIDVDATTADDEGLLSPSNPLEIDVLVELETPSGLVELETLSGLTVRAVDDGTGDVLEGTIASNTATELTLDAAGWVNVTTGGTATQPSVGSGYEIMSTIPPSLMTASSI